MPELTGADLDPVQPDDVVSLVREVAERYFAERPGWKTWRVPHAVMRGETVETPFGPATLDNWRHCDAMLLRGAIEAATRALLDAATAGQPEGVLVTAAIPTGTAEPNRAEHYVPHGLRVEIYHRMLPRGAAPVVELDMLWGRVA